MSAKPLWVAGVLLLLTAHLLVADTVTLLGGERKTGRILGMEGEALVLSVQPVPGLPHVALRLPKSRLAALEFDADPNREEFLQGAGQEQRAEVGLLWERFAPLLSLPGSPSARIGLRHGLLLLGATPGEGRGEPRAQLERIASTAPTPAEREAARQGVLRCLLAGLHWERAETEAGSICKTPCGTPLLAEARLTLGLVQAARLRALIEENPRWRDDDFVRPERDRLHACALDGLLGAALLPGVPSELAARGLRAALDVYALAGDTVRARAVAGDLAASHAGTAEAVSAHEWLGAQQEKAQVKPK